MARIAGVFYVMNVALGPGLYVARKLVVLRDPAMTATNILTHMTLFHVGFVGNLIGTAAYIVVTALFYQLFKPVNRTLSLLAAFFSLTGCILIAIGCVFYMSPLMVLGGAHVTSAFTVAQLQATALTLFRLYGLSFNLSIVFFGFYGLLIGYLVLKSTFMPRILGVGMALSASCWMIYIMAITLALPVSGYILAGGIGELALAGWMLVAGVNSERWNEQASIAAFFPF